MSDPWATLIVCDLYSSRFLFGVSGLVFVCRLLVSVQLCSCGRGNIVMLDGVDLPARDESVGEHTQYTHIVLIWTARTTYSLSSTDVAFGTRETKQLSINGRTH